MKKRCWCSHGIGLLAVLCLFVCFGRLPALGVTQQVVLVGEQAVYTAGEQLQLQARLVPPREGVSWAWEYRLPGEAESTVICTGDKLVLELTGMHHGAVLCPVATLADGTVVRGTEKTLTVEFYCVGLEIGKLPAKTVYAPGEVFDPAGLQILANMSDGSRQDVTALCRYAPLKLDLDTEQVLAACQLRGENGGQKHFACGIPVTVQLPEQTDGPDGTDDTDPEGQTPDSGTQQKPGSSGSGDAVGGAPDGEAGAGPGQDIVDTEDQTPQRPDGQPLQDEPLWSAPTRGGVLLGIGLLILCAGTAAALWWVLRRAGRQDGGDPPGS